jgi:hypothetical protein
MIFSANGADDYFFDAVWREYPRPWLMMDRAFSPCRLF